MSTDSIQQVVQNRYSNTASAFTHCSHHSPLISMWIVALHTWYGISTAPAANWKQCNTWAKVRWSSKWIFFKASMPNEIFEQKPRTIWRNDHMQFCCLSPLTNQIVYTWKKGIEMIESSSNFHVHCSNLFLCWLSTAQFSYVTTTISFHIYSLTHEPYSHFAQVNCSTGIFVCNLAKLK